MTEGAAALAPLTTYHAPYRHPRESGGPDSRHGAPTGRAHLRPAGGRV